MKGSVAFSLFLAAVALNIASGKKVDNPIWNPKFVENVLRAYTLRGDQKATYAKKMGYIFDGLKAMCTEKDAMIAETINDNPSWYNYDWEATQIQVLEKNARSSGEKLESNFRLEKCGFKGAPSSIWAKLKVPLFSDALEQHGWQRNRIQKVISFIFSWTIKNAEMEDNKNSSCFEDKLMKDFPAFEDLSGDAYNEAIVKLAKRLAELMQKLGQNSKDGIDPEIH